MSRQYASYWNAFLFIIFYQSCFLSGNRVMNDMATLCCSQLLKRSQFCVMNNIENDHVNDKKGHNIVNDKQLCS